jgi:hypothetical protein
VGGHGTLASPTWAIAGFAIDRKIQAMSESLEAPPTSLPKTLDHNGFIFGVFFLFLGVFTLIVDSPVYKNNVLLILLQGLSFAIGWVCMGLWLRNLRRPRGR